MATKKPSVPDPTLQKLEAINSVLQDLFIIQAKLAGMNKERVRAIVGVGAARVSRIWQEIPNKK
jgi:hypothetical protein